MSKLITNKEFRARVVLKGLENNSEQFNISQNAVVRVRVKSHHGNTAYTDWVTQAYNASRDDNWALSTIDMIIPPTETVKVLGENAIIDIEISGNYVDKSGADMADTYIKTWHISTQVEPGLA